MSKIDSIVEDLSQLALKHKESNTRYCVAIVGVPGSGKTTIAQYINKRVNERCKELLSQQTITESNNNSQQLLQLPNLSTVLPMDGFHLLRHSLTYRTASTQDMVSDHFIPSTYQTTTRNLADELINTPYQSDIRKFEENTPDDQVYFIDGQYRAWPGSELAHKKRGAWWTFDPQLLAFSLFNIKYRSNLSQFFPSWDHAMKDPSYNAPINVSNECSLIIIEGLYLLVNIEPWYGLLHTKQYYDLFMNQQGENFINCDQNDTGLIDVGIIVHCDESITLERGSVRNWKAGITDTLEQSIERWKNNDIINGRILMVNMIKDEKTKYHLQQSDLTL